MIRPVRIQLSRKSGFNLQAHSIAVNGLPAVHVARPSRWANPWRRQDFYRPGENTLLEAQAEAVEMFRKVVVGFEANRLFCRPKASSTSIIGVIRAGTTSVLPGKNLACWCKPGDPCHADVLLELANGPLCEEVTG